MKNIVVIGAGQLGSRHLQALSKVNFQTRIEVVAPFADALEVAWARFNEISSNSKIPASIFILPCLNFRAM